MADAEWKPSDEQVQTRAERMHREQCYEGCQHPIGAAWLLNARSQLIAEHFLAESYAAMLERTVVPDE